MYEVPTTKYLSSGKIFWPKAISYLFETQNLPGNNVILIAETRYQAKTETQLKIDICKYNMLNAMLYLPSLAYFHVFSMYFMSTVSLLSKHLHPDGKINPRVNIIIINLTGFHL